MLKCDFRMQSQNDVIFREKSIFVNNSVALQP